MKNDLRIIKTKMALKLSFADLLKKETFDKITISKICDNALVNRVTFYNHYNDKFELFIDCMNDVTEEIITEAAKASFDIINLNEEDKLINFLKCIFDISMEKCIEFKSVIITFGNEGNLMLVYMTEKLAYDKINELFEKVYANKKPKYSIDVITTFIVGGLSKVLYEWLRTTHKNIDKETIKNDAHKLIESIIKSNLLFDK